MRQPEWIVMLIVASTLTACHAKPDPVQQASEDARAVAMVEAAQTAKPPVVALAPEPIAPGELAGHRLAGPSCQLFDAAGKTGSPMLVADHHRAMLKLDGLLFDYAADSGGAQLSPQLSEHDVGKSHALWLERGSGLDGITIRDAWDQIVFTTRGKWVCTP